MGLLKKTLEVDKYLSGHNLRFMRGLCRFVFGKDFTPEDRVGISISLSTYDKLIKLGYFKEIERKRPDRRRSDRRS